MIALVAIAVTRMLFVLRSQTAIMMFLSPRMLRGTVRVNLRFSFAR
ncbi:hypothetical protein WME89_06160 [Sorangium sp. So ce321]